MAEEDIKQVLETPEDVPPPEKKKKAGRKKQDAVNPPAPPPHEGDDGAIDMTACPVQPLGTYEGRYFFMQPNGQIRETGFTPLTKHGGLGDLFCGDKTWLLAHFPDDSGRKRAEDNFNAENAGIWLMKKCHEKGLVRGGFDVRTVGMWQSGVDGSLIVNVGDKVLLNGQWEKPGFRENSTIYGGDEAICPPADMPADVEDGRMVLEYLQSWNWENPDLCPEIMLGILGQAFLAGALEWKAHSLVYGEGGSGKTTLGKFCEAVLGPATHKMVNNFTEAGSRQKMDKQGRSFLLDEAEADSQSRNISAMIELTRQMSSAGGATIDRGTASGTYRAYLLNGAAMIFCILPCPLDAQDRRRWTRMRIGKNAVSAEDTENRKFIRTMKADAAAVSTKLWRRMIDNYRRFAQIFDIYASAMAARNIHYSVHDQVGTILAGRDVLLRDDMPSVEEAQREIDRFYDYLIMQHIVEDQESEGSTCLNWLTSRRCHMLQTNKNRSIGQVISDFISTGDVDGDRRVLEALGVRIERPPSRLEDTVIYIANSHSELRTVFRGSKWESGTWPTSLEQIDGAFKEKQKRFGGTTSRCIGLPWSVITASIYDADSDKKATAAQKDKEEDIDNSVPF